MEVRACKTSADRTVVRDTHMNAVREVRARLTSAQSISGQTQLGSGHNWGAVAEASNATCNYYYPATCAVMKLQVSIQHN